MPENLDDLGRSFDNIRGHLEGAQGAVQNARERADDAMRIIAVTIDGSNNTTMAELIGIAATADTLLEASVNHYVHAIELVNQYRAQKGI